MSICCGKSCSFELQCVSFFVNIYQFVCVSFFPFGFEGGMSDLIVLIPDFFLSIYFKPVPYDLVVGVTLNSLTLKSLFLTKLL